MKRPVELLTCQIPMVGCVLWWWWGGVSKLDNGSVGVKKIKGGGAGRVGWGGRFFSEERISRSGLPLPRQPTL